MGESILVINSGSSSLKFQLISVQEEKSIASGLIDRIGEKVSTFALKYDGQKTTTSHEVPNHTTAFAIVLEGLTGGSKPIVISINEIKALGHRVVHGGDLYASAVIIDEDVINAIDELSSLAPLHNPANLISIKCGMDVLPNAIHVAVFDTAFHQTIPEVAHRYALPEVYYTDYKIRVYGFHGTSHKYVVSQLKNLLYGKLPGKVITLHLGNGCSMSAIKDGICIDTSLGFTPADGLIMGTRAGDLDPGLVLYLVDKLGLSTKEVNDLINKKSGMLGLTGKADLRDIIEEAANGDAMANLALTMNAYRIKKYIGAYAAAMNGLDALVFTAGIGENSPKMRSLICNDLSFFGVELDEGKNNAVIGMADTIHSSKSKVQIWVVPTQEEVEIAREAKKFL
ncbi:MAG TPA: acetate kinase [Saprospiraceae bacterium]|nr:acetate kinase [Saprospiraceae bacterium]